MATEHGPLFRGVDLDIGPGLHALRIPAGPRQSALLLALAGRLRPKAGTVTVLGETDPRAVRKQCAVAAIEGVDELDDPVTVRTVLAEQRRWFAPWYASVPSDAGRAEFDLVYGENQAPEPSARIRELTDMDLFLLRVTLALLGGRPVLVVGDLEQVRDEERRARALDRLAAVSRLRTVLVGVTNPLGPTAPDHTLHQCGLDL
nr:hypothetical protein [Segniliparus rugosus]